MTNDDPDCFACRFYYVTHDATWPCGCHAFDFKSKRIPSRVVRESSGEPCGAHEPRPTPARGKATGEGKR